MELLKQSRNLPTERTLYEVKTGRSNYRVNQEKEISDEFKKII